MMIRDPRGREFDRDLGPSGHAYSGHHFESLWGTETKARVAKPLKPRCLTPTRHGNACQRPAGHNGKHQNEMRGGYLR